MPNIDSLFFLYLKVVNFWRAAVACQLVAEFNLKTERQTGPGSNATMCSRALQLLFTICALFALASTFPLSSDARVGVVGQQRPQTPATTDTVNIQPSARGGAVIVVVAKSRVRVGELVSFTLSPARIVSDSRYRVTIDFGDGTRQVTRQVVVTHRYRATGHYDVYASVVSTTPNTDPPDFNPQKEVPRVTLDARPSPADPNQLVNFNAQLSSDYPGIKYRFVFGDGSQTDWQNSARASHAYGAAGTYAAYVDLGLNGSGRIRQVGGSLRQSIVVNQPKRPDDSIIKDPKDPKIPDRLPGPVRLTAGPTPVQQGKPVNFGARAEATNSNVRYRFVFGDGSSRAWQPSDKATHEYSSKGNYSATVSLGLIRDGKIKALSSDKQRIQVTSSLPATALDLQVAPTSVSMGQAVGFDARVTPVDRDLRYRFVFGEGPSQTEWQTGSQTWHTYNAAGVYAAHVEIGRWTNGRVLPVATSDTRVVSVTEGVISSASPKPTQSGGGGGGGSPGDSGSIASPTIPREGDAGTGLPGEWWPYWLLLIPLLFAAYKGYQALVAPRTTFHANRDPGEAEVDAAAKGLEISSQVLLRPNVSDAQYLVHSDDAIVRSVRRDNV